jgi:UDP-N-acetylglucosamine 2-epimerase (non-hydrolysing)
MLDQVLNVFNITPDIDLNIMQPNQSLPDLTVRLIQSLDKAFENLKADMVLVQGDTTTVFCAALASFYRRIPFGHVEAGLRTYDKYNPFPEEMNRVLAGHLASVHFAPTKTAEQALLREGIKPESIFVTGNTVIDALLIAAQKNIAHGLKLDNTKKIIAVTAHRRENFGEPFLNICRALLKIADQHEDVQIIYPVHPNPNIFDVAHRELGHHPRIILCKPLDYLPFVALMKQAYCLLTDSGGVQEEAPALGKPVLVLRTETERPEAIEFGVVKLVGVDEDVIVAETNKLLNNKAYYASMAKGVSPYGDGHAAERIVKILQEKLL